MYKLEHLNTTTAQGLPLYPVRLVPTTGIFRVLSKTDIDRYHSQHGIAIHAQGTHLYFNSEADALFYMLGHNNG